MQGNGAAPAPAEAASAHQRRATRTRNGLTPEQRRQQRRAALIDAGLDLFGTKGYNATSVEEICRTAYVSTRNFYEEFENREALLWHLVYQTVAEAYDALRRGQPGESDAPRSMSRGLRARIDRMVRAFVDDPRRARLVFLECRGMSLLHEYRRRAAQSAFAALLDEILEERGVVSDINARSRNTLSLAMVGAFDLVLSDWVLEPERCPVPELVESLIEVASWMGAGAMVTASPSGPAPDAG